MIFDVVNKSNVGAWMMAKDEVDAVSAAREIGHIKGAPKRVHDVTQALASENGIAALEAQGFRGRIAKQLYGMSGTEFMTFLKTGVEPVRPAPVWFGQVPVP